MTSAVATLLPPAVTMEDDPQFKETREAGLLGGSGCLPPPRPTMGDDGSPPPPPPSCAPRLESDLTFRFIKGEGEIDDEDVVVAVLVLLWPIAEETELSLII